MFDLTESEMILLSKHFSNSSITDPSVIEYRHLVLEITSSCNLSCSYCHQKHSDNMMSISTMENIINKEIACLHENEYLTLDLYGGEPFLNFELIEHAIYLTRKNEKIDSVYIITNGTIIDEKIKDILISNKDIVYCSLSLDGNKNIHDMQRDRSFDSIDISFFSDNFKDVPISLTVTPHSLDSMYNSIVFCHENGFLVNAGFDDTIVWNPELIKELIPQLTKLIDYYLDNPSIEPCNLLSGLPPYTEGRKIQWCGAGEDTIAYSYDGSKHICQSLLHVPLFKIEEKLNHVDCRCMSCPAVNYCLSCYSRNIIHCNSPFLRDHSFCSYKLVVLKARSYLQYKLNVNNLEKTDAGVLRSIHFLQKNITI